MILEMENKTSLCDYFVVMSAPSTVRAKAIAEHLEDKMEQHGVRVLHKEGLLEARWILLDFGSVIAHIFYHETRKFYDLEHLWGDAPRRQYLQ